MKRRQPQLTSLVIERAIARWNAAIGGEQRIAVPALPFQPEGPMHSTGGGS
jgi:hypothetical protein